MPVPSKQPSGRKKRLGTILRRLFARQSLDTPALWKEPIGWKKKVLDALPARTRQRLRMRSGLSSRISSIKVLSAQLPELEKGFRRSLRKHPKLETDLGYRAPETFQRYILAYKELLTISRRSEFEREYQDLSRETHLFSLSSQTLADLGGQSKTLRDASRLFEKRRKQALQYGFRDSVFRNSLANMLVLATRWHLLFELEQKARQRLQQFAKPRK